eukprot:jgi/Botrbrau1/17620/Bobra.0166s0055.1
MDITCRWSGLSLGALGEAVPSRIASDMAMGIFPLGCPRINIKPSGFRNLETVSHVRTSELALLGRTPYFRARVGSPLEALEGFESVPRGRSTMLMP